MEYLGYDVTPHINFSIKEIDAMYSNDALNVLLKHTESDKKVYVEYFFQNDKKSASFNKKHLDDLVDRRFEIDSVIGQNDTLVVVVEDEPNDGLITRLKQLYEQEGKFVVVHNIDRLQYNLLEHTLVPKGKALTEQETSVMKQKYNIKLNNQFPEISRFDPQALALCLRPNEVCVFERKSLTAISTKYYRICVN
jgi:DNA-directed RNA polymerase subunit H (RpoH/RPB5)